MIYICLCLTSVHSLSHIWLFVTPWTTACQASLSIITPRACSNFCPSSRWCHPTTLSDLFHFIRQSLDPSMLPKTTWFCSLLWMNNIPLCVLCLWVYPSIYIYISIDRYLDCFHVLVIVNSAVMKFGVHVSFQIMVFSRYTARNETVESYGSSNFGFFNELPYCSF